MPPTPAHHPKQDGSTNRFCRPLDRKHAMTAKLHMLKTAYAVDTSGSTAGRILNDEKLSISMMQECLSCDKLISWNSGARVVPGANLHELRGTGGTMPEKFVPLVGDETQLLVLHTDGMIPSYSMPHFSTAMDAMKSKIPIIVVFTLAPSYCKEGTTLKQIERQVNMSIPESCIAFSDDVLIVINSDGSHRTLMSKGIFSSFGQPSLDNSTRIEELPECCLADLKMVRTQKPLPPNLIRLHGWDKPVSLEALYQADLDDEETVKDLLPVLHKLCQRIYLPNLDLVRLRVLLTKLSRKQNENQELRKAQDELARLAVSDLAGTEQHRLLVKKLRALRASKLAPDAVACNSMIHRFLSMIAEYNSGNASFVLGSNRATGAAVIEDAAFANRGKCIQIECPIMLASEDACLLLTTPSVEDLEQATTAAATQQHHESASIEILATTDLAMEAPFWCGWALRTCVQPNLVGYEFAESASRHPFTGQDVIGFVPLSHDPAVVMRYMSRIFGHSKELWHMVRAYVSMVAYNLDSDWCDPLLKQHLQILFDNYSATIDLRGGTEKVPLRQAFQHCLANFATCLRNRFPQDIRAIIHIAKRVIPEHSFEETKISGMLEVLEKFNQLLRAHKKREKMMQYVMNVDPEFHHFESQRCDLSALIGYIFWTQDCQGKNDYRNRRLQLAIDTIISQDPLGDQLSRAFNGRSFSIPPVALKEPEGVHFRMPPKYESWTKHGRPLDRCVYCGCKFLCQGDRFAHLRQAMGPHFYNGQEKVLESISEMPRTASVQNIFRLTKKKLYRKYGEMAGFLHTRRCKRILLWMIRNIREEMDR